MGCFTIILRISSIKFYNSFSKSTFPSKYVFTLKGTCYLHFRY